MKSKLVRVLGTVLAAALFAGCACVEPGAPAPTPRPKAKPVSRGTCPIITTAGNKTSAVMLIPTGDMDSSVVQLTTTTPTEVYVGETIDYTMEVKNLTDCPLDDVILSAMIPDGFEFKGSSPQAKIDGAGNAEWDLSKLAGKQAKTVTVRGIPTKAGAFVTCAKVTYKPILCTSFVAVAPKLALEKTMPASVMKCDPIPIKLVVTNAGTGTLHGVTVVDTLPAGLETTDGRTQVTFPAGDLAAGQSKTMNINAKATRTGTFTNKAVATAGKLTAEDSATIKVTQPVLGITKTAKPDTQFVGRMIDYTIKVTNKGDAPANDLVVTDNLPAGATFVSASNGGAASGNTVVWRVASLAPKASATFQVKVKAMAAGKLENKATAAARCAAAVAASKVTPVTGKAAILLEVIDVADPLSVGDEETYIITATNQGSAPDTNIKMVCKIEDSQAFVSAKGPNASVTGTHAKGTVTFTPLGSLAPKAKASWQVKVKALKTGDIRFAVEMTTDELTRPVRETEATQIY